MAGIESRFYLLSQAVNTTSMKNHILPSVVQSLRGTKMSYTRFFFYYALKSLVARSNKRNVSKLNKRTNETMGKIFQEKKIVQKIADWGKYSAIEVCSAEN